MSDSGEPEGQLCGGRIECHHNRRHRDIERCIADLLLMLLADAEVVGRESALVLVNAAGVRRATCARASQRIGAERCVAEAVRVPLAVPLERAADLTRQQSHLRNCTPNG